MCPAIAGSVLCSSTFRDNSDFFRPDGWDQCCTEAFGNRARGLEGWLNWGFWKWGFFNVLVSKNSRNFYGNFHLGGGFGRYRPP